jgi:hypothetical protein
MMGNAFGHWIDLQGMVFADSDGTWLQALPLGTYDHPEYGDIRITPDRVQRFAMNVQQRVRGQDLDIDYDHKADTKIAAGWVSDAQARPDGLWVKVIWTPAAMQKLQDKEYRYFSPEFVDEWQHPKTGALYKDVLFGGALTNRPFLKDILPINLSEMVGDSMNPNDGKTGAGGTPPTDADNMVGLATVLGLHGQVTSADILAAAQKKLAEGGTPQNTQNTQPPATQLPAPQAPQNIVLSVPTPTPPPAQQVNVGGQQFQLVPIAAPTTGNGQQGSLPTQVQVTPVGAGGQQQLPLGNLLQPVQLNDALTGDPVALADVVRAQNEKIGLLASAHKLAESQAFVMSLNEGDGHIGLSPVVRELALELLVKAPTALGETVEKFLRVVAEGKATVALGELGRARTGDGSVVKQFSAAIDKLRKDNEGMTYADAVEQLSREDSRLANEYRQATMAGEE